MIDKKQESEVRDARDSVLLHRTLGSRFLLAVIWRLPLDNGDVRLIDELDAINC
jgi:hypothetical protein